MTAKVAATAHANGTTPDSGVMDAPAIDAFAFTFEMPGRREDAPPASSKKTRRIEAPDGLHWFEVRGGGTQVEGAFITFLFDTLQRSLEQLQAKEIDVDTHKAATMAFNSGMATFLADRVVAHNLVDYDGDPLPLGLALFWAMPGDDALRLAGRIQSRDSVWASPKAETSSTDG